MPQETKKLIELQNAGVFRSGGWLVRGISMSVNAGEIITLIGPNGSGKSTTAMMALGLIKTDEGSTFRRPNLRVGYVPQKLSIDWTLPLTVRRFISLTKNIHANDIDFALSLTDTSHLAKKELRTLSCGELQRVLVARAIALSPEFLVLDEPVQGVDFNGEARLYSLIEETRKRLNCGILLISHDLHMVMSATDQVICLNGHICCSGSPEVVTSSSEFRTLFGDKVASTLALYQHKHNHEHALDGSIKSAPKNKSLIKTSSEDTDSRDGKESSHV